MCPIPAKRVILLTCICRNSAATLAVTGLSEPCGAFLSASIAVDLSTHSESRKDVIRLLQLRLDGSIDPN